MYPLVSGVPVLLSSSRSLFSVDSVGEASVFVPPRTGASRWLRRCAPRVGTNLFVDEAARYIAGSESFGSRQVLVLGAGDPARGIHIERVDPTADVLRSDIRVAHDIDLVIDAHDIPFEEATFDVVIAQAVLEHVLDPVRCVAEIHRVLRPGGLVYAETPFIQQVHGGRYDFTRFTHLGHRRLFRSFDEVMSGVVGGPGTALAWSWEYFLMSFFRSHRARQVARVVGRATSFYLKYLDRFVISRPTSWDAASGYAFLGQKSEGPPLSDHELIASYRGGI